MRKHRVPDERLGLVLGRYEKVYAWVVRDARRYVRARSRREGGEVDEGVRGILGRSDTTDGCAWTNGMCWWRS